MVFKLIRLCDGCLSLLSEVPFTRSGDWGSHEMYNSKVYNKQTEYSTYMECNDFREDQNEYYVKHHDSDTEIETETKQ